MRYGSFLEPEAFAFEDRESGFEIFEAPDYEAAVGGIPERDYLRWMQFSLNMYFKKTALRGPVTEDGKDSTEFRDALELFNAKATGRKGYRGIDERTQDALIIANEQNAGYLAWLRTQLDRLGLTAFTTRYAANEKPTAAITTFQDIYNGVSGFSLVQDGFVGAKTHLAILRAIHALKPKPKPRLEPPIPSHPVFRKPAAIPLIERWMPRCTRASPTRTGTPASSARATA